MSIGSVRNSGQKTGKLIVLTSHPIQYQAPLWREMAKAGLNFEVWFLTDQGARHTEDKDFGQTFAWDVDLLSGYPHRFLELRGAWDIKKFNGVPLAKPIGESLRESGASAVWIEGWRLKPFWDAAFAAKRAGLQVLLRAETSDKIRERGGIFGLFRKWALRRLFSRVDHFLVIGQACRRFYRGYGVPEAKMLETPYGVDNEFFRRESGKIRGLKDQELKRPKDGGAHFDKEQPLLAADQETRDETTTRRILTDGQKAVREEWNILPDAKVLVFCGKFVRKKRPMDVVEAVRLLAGKAEPEPKAETGQSQTLKYRNTEIRTYHLLFVGSGELGDELRAACDVRFDADGQDGRSMRHTAHGIRPDADAAGPPARRTHGSESGGSASASGSTLHAPCFAYGPSRQASVLPPATFAGFLNQSQISKAYAVADVMVLPSEAWETWGLVVNEATAAGVPTVIGDQCGCADDFAAKNPYSRVFPTGDVSALARSIGEVLALEADPNIVSQYAEEFSLAKTVKAVADPLAQRRGVDRRSDKGD